MLVLLLARNIAFGNITSSMSNQQLNVDHLTVYSGLADAVSSLFGGAPVEAIISATGAAPDVFVIWNYYDGDYGHNIVFGITSKTG